MEDSGAVIQEPMASQTVRQGLPANDPSIGNAEVSNSRSLASPPHAVVTIPAGVAVGMLLQRTIALYPAAAKAAHVSGTVVLQVTISKTGTIEDLHVVTGPPMLQQSVLGAVKTWRYRPYLINGEPVEVETTVNAIFTLGSQ
jgi:protein TonB